MAVYNGAVDGSGVYTHALRVQNVFYPLLTGTALQTYYNTDSSIDGRLQRARYIKLFDGDLLTGDVTQTARYEYNGTGRVVRVETYSGGTVDLERTMATATGVYGHWDRFGRTRTQRWFRSTTTHDEVTNQHYDYAGNRLYRDIPDTLYAGNDLDQAYEYDGLQRLANFQQGTIASGVIINKNFAQDWTLDQLGNWPTFKQDNDGNGTWEFIQNRTHTLANEVTGISTWVNPVYDAVGNMTTMPQPFNPADDFAATYDAWNRLVELDDGEDLQVAYEYDGLHHRIQKNIDTITWDYYYNDQWQLLTEAVNEQVEAIYAWHPYYIDALAIRFDDSERHVFLHDANFNVTAAFDVRPSSSTYRQVVERYTYTPYGEVTFLNADFSVKTTQKSDIGNNHLYTGRERDPETGLQLNRNRILHAPLGRWLTWDPVEYLAGDANLYGYVGGRPTYYEDPTGEIAIAIPAGWAAWEIGVGIGAGIGAAWAWWNRDQIAEDINNAADDLTDAYDDLTESFEKMGRGDNTAKNRQARDAASRARGRALTREERTRLHDEIAKRKKELGGRDLTPDEIAELVDELWPPCPPSQYVGGFPHGMIMY